MLRVLSGLIRLVRVSSDVVQTSSDESHVSVPVLFPWGSKLT